jgi:hypothetical protein
MLGISTSGDHNKTIRSLQRLTKSGDIFSGLDRYGQMGVDALSRATPVDSNRTANSWGYRIVRDRRGVGIEWFNTNDANGTPVAILIQYGHGTGTGGYVHGRDFINPAMRPVFDTIANEIWKKVKA